MEKVLTQAEFDGSDPDLDVTDCDASGDELVCNLRKNVDDRKDAVVLGLGYATCFCTTV